MDPASIAVFIPIMGILGFVGLAGAKIWSTHKLKMRETTGGDNESLVDALQQLHDEVALMREDFAELNERVDFTERLLSEVRAKNSIGPGDPA